MLPTVNAAAHGRAVPCLAQLDNLFLHANGRVILGDFGEATFLVNTDGTPKPASAGEVIVRDLARRCNCHCS